MRKHFTTREAAKRIGVTAQTLYTWIERGLVKAPEQIRAGGATFRLWSADDIAAARKTKGKLKPGPKPKGGRHAR